jgi:hypothetical protein
MDVATNSLEFVIGLPAYHEHLVTFNLQLLPQIGHRDGERVDLVPQLAQFRVTTLDLGLKLIYSSLIATGLSGDKQ